MAHDNRGKGDQSGVNSLVQSTDTISDNVATQRMQEAGPNDLGPKVDPVEALQNARSDIRRDMINDAVVAAEYDRLANPEPDAMESMADVREAAVVVSSEVPTGADFVGSALVERENAAKFLDKETEKKLIDYVHAHFDLSYDRMSKRYDYWKDAEVTHDIFVPSRVIDDSKRKSRQNYSSGRIIDQIKTPYSRSISDTICTYNLAIFGGAPPFRIEPTSRDTSRKSARILEQRLHHNMRRVGYEQRLYQIFLDNNRYGMAPVANFYGKDGNVPVNIDPWAYFLTRVSPHRTDTKQIL